MSDLVLPLVGGGVFLLGVAFGAWLWRPPPRAAPHGESDAELARTPIQPHWSLRPPPMPSGIYPPPTVSYVGERGDADRGEDTRELTAGELAEIRRTLDRRT